MSRTTDPIPFTVAGSGEFPFDMLRYDCAWPATSADANKVGMECRDVRARDSRRVINLLCLHSWRRPTIGRWESFGWRVISHDKATGARMHDDDVAAAIEAEHKAERAVS